MLVSGRAELSSSISTSVRLRWVPLPTRVDHGGGAAEVSRAGGFSQLGLRIACTWGLLMFC